LIYNEGISKEGEIIGLGEKFGIISKSGSSYAFGLPGQGEEKIGRGYDSARQFLKENPKVTNQILKAIRENFKEAA